MVDSMLADFIIRQNQIEFDRMMLTRRVWPEITTITPSEIDTEYFRKKIYKSIGIPAHLITGDMIEECMRKLAAEFTLDEPTIDTVEVKEHPTRKLKAGFVVDPYSAREYIIEKGSMDIIGKGSFCRKFVLNCAQCGCKCIMDFEVIHYGTVFCPNCGAKDDS